VCRRAARARQVIAAIVLAAGLSRRLGRAKLLEDVGGETLIRRTVRQVIGAGIGEVIVVVGPALRESFAAALDGLDVRLVINPAPETGQSGSLRVGVEALPAGVSDVLVALGDQPELPGEVVPRLRAALDESGAALAAPRYRDGRGNPVLFRASVLAQELSDIAGDQGARSLIDRDPSRVVLVPFDRPMPADVDTAEDLAALRARSGAEPGVH
jgi:molybdenum cofactor cytidylyltransferase